MRAPAVRWLLAACLVAGPAAAGVEPLTGPVADITIEDVPLEDVIAAHLHEATVHGDVEHPPANEDAPLRPGDVYQDTKLEGERLARDAVRDGADLLDLGAESTRPGHTEISAVEEIRP